MIGHGQPLGLFHLNCTQKGFGPEEDCAKAKQLLATAVAETIALAVSNVRLREALREQTIRDPLTRLYNRRYLEDSLNREISRARRAGSSVGIIMIDIDNFKLFNDSLGHPMGDQLLCSLGTYLNARVRPEDIPSRLGGDEFTVLLSGASRGDLPRGWR